MFMQRVGTYVPSTPSPFTDDLDAVLAHRLPVDSAIVLEFSGIKLAANVGVVLFGIALIIGMYVWFRHELEFGRFHNFAIPKSQH